MEKPDLLPPAPVAALKARAYDVVMALCQHQAAVARLGEQHRQLVAEIAAAVAAEPPSASAPSTLNLQPSTSQ